MTATHLHRNTHAKAGANARKKKRPALPDVAYPPGFFTEPVRAWTQMKFVSRWGSAERAVPKPQRGIGFDLHHLNLPGAVSYVTAGPVETMRKADS